MTVLKLDIESHSNPYQISNDTSNYMTPLVPDNKYGKGRIIADTRPGRANIYLDGDLVIDTSGNIAKTPTVIHNVSEGIHTVTFNKLGYNDITMIAEVSKNCDCHTRALLNTSMFTYPMMLSTPLSDQEDLFQILDYVIIDDVEPQYLQQYLQQDLQPSPGWPYLPIRQSTYGHLVASTTPDGAEIYLDDQPVRDINGNIALTPSSIIGITTGMHTITFKKDGFIDATSTVDIKNGLYSQIHDTLYSIVKKSQ